MTVIICNLALLVLIDARETVFNARTGLVRVSPSRASRSFPLLSIQPVQRAPLPPPPEGREGLYCTQGISVVYQFVLTQKHSETNERDFRCSICRSSVSAIIPPFVRRCLDLRSPFSSCGLCKIYLLIKMMWSLQNLIQYDIVEELPRIKYFFRFTQKSC